jgi:hypothetical protein
VVLTLPTVSALAASAALLSSSEANSVFMANSLGWNRVGA